MSIDKDEKTIGEIIAEAREKKDLSQRQLAKLAGVNSSGLSKIEAGERDPSPKILRKISKYINVNYSDLMYKMGYGIEVSTLNPFIKDYYEKMNLEELNDAELNALGTIKNLRQLVDSCKEKLNDDIPEMERELLWQTIEDNTYQLNTAQEIIDLVQSLKLEARNRNEKKNKKQN